MSNRELARVSKADFQLFVDAFYTDDWERCGTLADRLETLGERWRQQPEPEADKEKFAKGAEGFAGAATELKSAVANKDVEQTTAALRKLASHLAELEKMP